MKNRIVLGAATAAVAFAPMAMADFELGFDMSGIDVEDGAYVYYNESVNEYEGRAILGIGARDLVVNFSGESGVTFAWAFDLSTAGYGQGIFIFASDGPFPALSQETFNFEYDVSGYAGVVLPLNFGGDWNAAAFIGSGGTNDMVHVASGEMYYILEGDPIPAPGALALLGLAGIAGVRRRRR